MIHKVVSILVIIVLICVLSGVQVKANQDNEKIDSIVEDVLFVTTEYIYRDDNTVLAKIHSNIPLKNNKPAWKLSEDGLTYSIVLKSNGSYYTGVQDVYGNTERVFIEVDRNR